MTHKIVKPGFERRDARGTFLEISNGFPAQTVICGRMKAGGVLGNHYHRRTRVFFYVSRGSAQVVTVHEETGERDAFMLRENQGAFFEVNETHAVRFIEDGEFVMLKSLPYDAADPDTFARAVIE